MVPCTRSWLRLLSFLIGVTLGSQAAVEAQVEVTRVHQGRSIRTNSNILMGDKLGRGTVGGVDFDGDGVNDYAALAQRDIYGGGIINGAIRVYSGATGGEIVAFHPAPAPVNFLGDDLGVLDIDGDGRGELVVPIQSFESDERIEVYSFNPLRLRYSIANPNAPMSSSFPSTVFVIPDLTGDGRPDIVATDSYAPEFFVFSGANGALFRVVGAPDPQLTSFGFRGGPIGDVTGDGIGDLFISAGNGIILYDGLAIAQNLADPSYQGLALTDPEHNFNFAEAVVGVGDLNGDGRGEIAVGTTGFLSSTAGVVDIISFDAAGNLSVPLSLVDPGQQHFGHSLATVRDVTGDGKRELAVSTFDRTEVSLEPGYVTLYSLGDGTALRTFRPSVRAASLFGIVMSNVSDINRDGVDELLIGCPEDTGGNPPSDFVGNPTLDGFTAGAAYLFSAAPAAFFPAPTPTPAPTIAPTPTSGSGGNGNNGGGVPLVVSRINKARTLANAVAVSRTVAAGKKALRSITLYLKRELTGAGASASGAAQLKKAQKLVKGFKASGASAKSYQKLGKKLLAAL